jgi:hypothetical protein
MKLINHLHDGLYLERRVVRRYVHRRCWVLLIRIALLLSAVICLFYPVWGIIAPSSYLNELVETFPFAIGASDVQVQKSSLLLLIPNLAISIAFIFIAKFIASPNSYRFAKIASVSFVAFPFLQSISDIFIGSILSQHTQSASVAIELSGQKLFYILFGLAIWGIYKSQCEHIKTIMADT